MAGSPPYAGPAAGLPDQKALLSGRAVFTDSYAVIPRAVMTDIVTSFFPHWQGARGWIIARPLSGFAETFSHYVMEVAPGGGSTRPEPDEEAEAVLFVTKGAIELSFAGAVHQLGLGGYAYLPAGLAYEVANRSGEAAQFHWIRKAYEPVDGLASPAPFVTSDQAVTPIAMPGSQGSWATSRFADPADLRHDMHVNIVTFQPGGLIPFMETHVMEHGLYVLEGKAVYRLNSDWVEVEAGDYMWLRAFCPQACYAGGPGPFRYLLYKDVNRHPALRLAGKGIGR